MFGGKSIFNGPFAMELASDYLQELGGEGPRGEGGGIKLKYMLIVSKRE